MNGRVERALDMYGRFVREAPSSVGDHRWAKRVRAEKQPYFRKSTESEALTRR